MVINDLMELIKNLFGNNYENVVIVDAGDRTEHCADEEPWLIDDLKKLEVVEEYN